MVKIEAKNNDFKSPPKNEIIVNSKIFNINNYENEKQKFTNEEQKAIINYIKARKNKKFNGFL